MEGWQRGLPPGPLTDAMLRDFEVYFSPGGVKWYRERSEDQKLEYDRIQRERDGDSRAE